MANKEHLDILEQGVEVWNRWSKDNPDKKPDLSAADLRGATLISADLTNAHLVGAFLDDADLTKARLVAASLTKASLCNADLTEANLLGADLTGANLFQANLTNADLVAVNLTNAHLHESEFRRTRLIGLRFASDHSHLNDGSHEIKVHWRERWLNWGVLRGIGNLPLFGVSWGAFALGLLFVSYAGQVHGAERAPPWIKDMISVPPRMWLFLLSSMFFVIGSTFYRLLCPPEIQQFSEAEWVAAHNRPRLIHKAASWQRRWAQWPTLVFTAVGGVLGSWLILDRLYFAVRYLVAAAG